MRSLWFVATLLIILSPAYISSTSAVDKCASLTDCSVCSATAGCGFCVDPNTPTTPNSGSCIEGNATAPRDPTACAAAAYLGSASQCGQLPCVEPLPPLSASFGSCLTTSGWIADSASCSFICDDGFVLIGDPLLYCQNGNINGTQFCTNFNPAAVLPRSNFKMTSVDYFLLIFMSVWSVMILLISILLLAGKILPHLGAPVPNLQLWDIDNLTSAIQKQQICRRWVVALIGTIVVCLGVAALATDQYTSASYPDDRYDISVIFRSFGYEIDVGEPFNSHDKEKYPSCTGPEVADSTLCYFFRTSLYVSFIFAVIATFSAAISLIFLVLVLLRFKREGYWKHAMKLSVVALLAFISSVLIYGSCTHVILRGMYSEVLDLELSISWFLLLGVTLLGGIWTAMTFLYYRPTTTDDDEEEDEVERQAFDRKLGLGASAAASSGTGTPTRMKSSARDRDQLYSPQESAYGAMTTDPFA